MSPLTRAFDLHERLLSYSNGGPLNPFFRGQHNFWPSLLDWDVQVSSLKCKLADGISIAAQPWLQGSMSVESGDSHFRPVLVDKLATAIYDGYIESDDGEWLRKTGQIFKHRHLRNAQNRKVCNNILDIAANFEKVNLKRLWTVSLFRSCLIRLLEQKQLEIPLTPTFDTKSWIKDQSDKLHHLVRRAAKNRWQEARGLILHRKAMDTADTQQWDEDFMFNCQNRVWESMQITSDSVNHGIYVWFFWCLRMQDVLESQWRCSWNQTPQKTNQFVWNSKLKFRKLSKTIIANPILFHYILSTMHPGNSDQRRGRTSSRSILSVQTLLNFVGTRIHLCICRAS